MRSPSSATSDAALAAADVLRVRVARKERLALDVCAFELVAEGGAVLPPFAAGAHVEVHLEAGRSRAYSLCNDPREAHRYLIAVLREAEGRGGSRQLHDAVQEGDRLAISPPRNHFPLQDGAPHSLLVAGGIGITPILGMAERLAAAAACFDLHYLVRSRGRAAFLDRIGASAYAGRLRLHVDDDPATPRFDAAAAVAGSPPGTHLYVCGPAGLMNGVLGAARAAGWDESRLHREHFAADPARAPAEAGAPFEVELARSGRIVVVPADRSVTQVLAEAGVAIDTSCEEGVCGTCLTRVVAGIPEHRDYCLTSAEQAANDRFLPCCSRSRTSRLVLDL